METIFGDWGLYRDYYRDPFPHSLLRTRQSFPGDAGISFLENWAELCVEAA